MFEKCFIDCYYNVGGTCKFYDWDPSEEHMECRDAEIANFDENQEN